MSEIQLSQIVLCHILGKFNINFCTTIYNFVLFAHSYFSHLLLLSPKFRGYVKFAERQRSNFGRSKAKPHICLLFECVSTEAESRAKWLHYFSPTIFLYAASNKASNFFKSMLEDSTLYKTCFHCSSYRYGSYSSILILSKASFGILKNRQKLLEPMKVIPNTIGKPYLNET